MTIKTKKNGYVCDGLIKNKKYEVISITEDKKTNSGYVINLDRGASSISRFDPTYFRLNSLKLVK